jgi:hypothetical protein
VRLRAPVPPLLRRLSSDEYRPLPWRPADREALARFGDTARERAHRAALGLSAYAEDRRGTAAALRAIDAAAGGGFYTVPAEAEIDAATADAYLDGGEASVVVDVQTHLVNPSSFHGPEAAALTGFLQMTDPDRWSGGVDPARISAAEWAALVFGGSETAVALLTSLPGQSHENVLSNAEIAACREVVDRYAGSGRVLTHTIVHPNYGPGEIEAMQAWRDGLRPSGWKVYTLWDPPETVPPGGMPIGWFLDDEAVGIRSSSRSARSAPGSSAPTRGSAGPYPGPRRPGPTPATSGPRPPCTPTSRSSCTTPATSPTPPARRGPTRRIPAGVSAASCRAWPAPGSARGRTCTPSSGPRGS